MGNDTIMGTLASFPDTNLRLVSNLYDFQYISPGSQLLWVSIRTAAPGDSYINHNYNISFSRTDSHLG